ncbi:hypothetical protein TanjilG_19821 [Lupinus angustifolius]|uniref:MATH domain-containing protein n=1 Tax=Lupinus angustifolius TaxID=3871 RepID=A0A1J7GXI7_LUPAN|nr:PREDICTED: MATH domain and coiled-coil domain-containing protein At3g58270-like [Lupinus angustifolius]XP_019455477.1 PREDICTED: MATH domain and coiled-coil domain-containing protein At3g58270-like [Lupinus angustifolius]OIW05190.1 hypothetical protein TanjilG_19821 [Lupinus angustifolius]
MENQHGTKINLEKFTWIIESFSKKNTKKLRSKSFVIGGCRWRIVVQPIEKGVDHLSLCLKISGPLPAYGWSKFAYFKLSLINQMDNEKSIVKETQQKFDSRYRIWGSSFMHLSDFYNPKQGYLINGHCIIAAQVAVSDHAFQITTPSLTNSISVARLIEYSEETRNSTIQTKSEFRSQEDFGIVIPPSERTHSPNHGHINKPSFYPSIYDDGPKEVPVIHLSEILDINSLGPEEATFFPLLEEVCLCHPSLIESQMKKSPKYILWAFITLGQVLHFLKTTKMKNMDEKARENLECLWEEVQLFGFDLTWLEPYIQSALDVKAYLEKAEKVKNLKDIVVYLETEVRKLRTKLAIAEVDVDIARKDLEEVEMGLEERNIDAKLGYDI